MEVKEEVRKRKPSGSVIEKIEQKVKEVKPHLNKIKNKVITSKEVQKMTHKYEKFVQRRENPEVLKTYDQITYSFGLISMFITFSLFSHPDVRIFAAWASFANFVLIIFRFFQYKQKSWHYYFYDFCYVLNCFTWLFLICFPKSPILFFTMATNGTVLLNYFIIFRPKLAFQNIDAVTSFFMHYTTPQLFYVLRHANKEAGYFLTTEELDKYTDSFQGIFKIWLWGCGFYIAWCLFYYVMIFYVKKDRIRERNYSTLYSYTIEDLLKLAPFLKKVGEKHGPETYMCVHAFQGLVGNTLSLIFVRYKWVALVSLYAYLLVPIWTSSIYYFKYFSRDYNNKLEKRADLIKEKRMKRSTSVTREDSTSKRKMT